LSRALNKDDGLGPPGGGGGWVINFLIKVKVGVFTTNILLSHPASSFSKINQKI
jgi:hypothetical protein